MTTHNQIVHIFKLTETYSGEWTLDPPITSEDKEEASKMLEKLPMKAPTLLLAPPLEWRMYTSLLAFHPKFNTALCRIASEGTTENIEGNDMMQHFAKGNVTFMVDPRLQGGVPQWRYDERNGRIGLPSRREMYLPFKKYFVFPEEFYPKDSEGKNNDPDKDQDWYKHEGMWTPDFKSVEFLERAASFKEFLYNRPEKEIIVITYRSFIDALIGDYWSETGFSCIWKSTNSGRMRLVPLTSPISQKDILEDVEYPLYWPYRLCKRSEIFKKWHKEPLKEILELLIGFEERKKYLGLDVLTFESLEVELGPEAVREVKDRVKGWIDYTL